MNLTDRELLARTIMAEAGNQGPIGMMGVGSVIMNRLQSPAYGNTLPSVILQPGQFSAWNSRKNPDGSFVYAGGQQGQNMSKIQPSEQAYMVADQILDGNFNDPTGGATHYYNPRISNPNWGQRAGGDWQQIGAHLFGVPGKKDPTRISTMNANNAPLNAIPSMGPVTQKSAQLMQPAAKPKQRGLFDFLGKAVGGTFDGLKGALDGSDPDKSDKLAIALMSLSGNPKQLQPLMQMAANDIQERVKKKSANKTIEYLKTVDPELARMAEQNPSMVGNIMSALASKKMSGKGGDLVTAAQLREMFPGQDVDDGLYNLKYENDKVVGATKVGGGNTVINNSSEKDDNILRDEMKEYLNIGRNARQTIAKAEFLGQLLDQAGSGLGAGLKQFAFDTFGIDVRDDAAAAAQAIISQLVPAQREEGSGPMSDADLNMYKLSIPSIAALPGGNKIIISSMVGIAQYNRAVGDLAKDQLLGKVTYDEFYEKMASLADPLAEAKAFMKANGIKNGEAGATVEMSEAEKEAYRTLGIPIPGV